MLLQSNHTAESTATLPCYERVNPHLPNGGLKRENHSVSTLLRGLASPRTGEDITLSIPTTLKLSIRTNVTAIGRTIVKMLEAECPECQQTVWITSDTRFATYHSVGAPPVDCPGSRKTIPVPPTPAAVRRALREAARAAAISASPRRQKNEALRASRASLAEQDSRAEQRSEHRQAS